MEYTDIKSTLEYITSKHLNYRIDTDIAVGRGINGIKFRYFWGHIKPDSSKTSIQCVKKIALSRSMVVLTVYDDTECSWSGGEQLVYLPLERIVSITGITNGGSYFEQYHPSYVYTTLETL